MSLFNEQLTIGTPASDRPYIPSYAAHEELLGIPKVGAANPGLHVSNGQLIGASNGGLITLAGESWGIDLVAVESNGSVLEITPTEKRCVHVDDPESGVGSIVGEGAVILSNKEQGLLVISGIITANRWMAEDALVSGDRVSRIGKRWVIQSAFAGRASVQQTYSSGEVSARLLPS